MRTLLCIVIFGIVVISFAADKPGGPSSGTEARPFVVKVLPESSPTADDRSANAAEKSADATVRSAEAADRSVITNVALTLVTFALFIVSFVVALSGRKDAREALKLANISAHAASASATETKRSADTAFKASMPLLTPWVSPELTQLHPMNTNLVREGNRPEYSEFESKVFFTFSNFGKTPAIVREVRADLFLLLNDDLLADINFDQLPSHDYSVIIPGEVKDGSGVTSVIDYKKLFQIPPGELDELLKAAHHPFRRLSLIGRVIYDDFFGHRHVRPFWVKLRLVPRQDGLIGLFQAQKGRRQFSSVTIEPIPNPDPLPY